MHLKVLLTFIFVAGLGVLLSGCTPDGEIAIRRASGEGAFEFVACQELSGWNRVEVLVATKGSRPSDLKLVWSADGAGGDLRDVQMEYGVAPNGMTTTAGPEHVGFSGEQIQVRFEQVGADGVINDDLFAQFDGDTLIDSGWLRGGSYHSEPCS